MNYYWQVHIFLACGLFLIGTVVGSFLNVVIYRMPLQKSVMWPDSRCPNCFGTIRAIENIPILSWLVLRASCRNCKLPISARYPAIEALTGLLFVMVYFVDAYFNERGYRTSSSTYFAVFYHCVFVAVLLAISMIDFDWTIVPIDLAYFGIAFGLIGGMIDPSVRPKPVTALTTWGGLGVGVLGVLVAAGLIWVVRIIGGLVFRREAMGKGDVDILAIVGAFMGWQAAVITFFLSSFFGLIPSLWKLVPYLVKVFTRKQWNPSEREIPLGPFLSMAGVTLLFVWHWAWPHIFVEYYELFAYITKFALGLRPD